MNGPRWLRLGGTVSQALRQGTPVVALETAVVTHGLPPPLNLEAHLSMEQEVKNEGAVPATCLIDGGALYVGAPADRVASVAGASDRRKASVRDVGALLSSGASAGLTVSGTLLAAQLAGIAVFATGGIGGVHLDAHRTGDVSSDLPQLARSPVVTVCSGAKSVLDIPRTLEFLETLGVPVFSYGTDEFPAFYLRSSGCSTARLSTPEEVAAAARTQWELGYRASVVLANPIPPDAALEPEQWETWMRAAHGAAAARGIRGQALTPYLLSYVAGASGGTTLQANLALLKSNARLAAQVARALGR